MERRLLLLNYDFRYLFFNHFSKMYLDEKDDAYWNNDEYFYDALIKMSNPSEYFGF